MIRCMLVKWSGITASKSDVFVWQKAPKGTLNPPVFGDLWPFPMMSVVDIPLSMLISLLPNQKTWNYIPLILNIYMFFTSHPPSTSITLGVSSYQVHGSHIRLWRGSSSYNQGYGRVICALESQSRFRWRLSSALPWGQPTSVFHMFFSYTRYAVVVFSTTSATSAMTDPRKRNRLQETLKLVKGCRPCNWGLVLRLWSCSGLIPRAHQWCLQMSTPSTRSI